jgi:hypothetical protein
MTVYLMNTDGTSRQTSAIVCRRYLSIVLPDGTKITYQCSGWESGNLHHERQWNKSDEDHERTGGRLDPGWGVTVSSRNTPSKLIPHLPPCQRHSTPTDHSTYTPSPQSQRILIQIRTSTSTYASAFNTHTRHRPLLPQLPRPSSATAMADLIFADDFGPGTHKLGHQYNDTMTQCQFCCCHNWYQGIVH